MTGPRADPGGSQYPFPIKIFSVVVYYDLDCSFACFKLKIILIVMVLAIYLGILGYSWWLFQAIT